MADQPGAEKGFSRWMVRSMYWSISTKLPGGASWVRLPTALTDSNCVQPTLRSAAMLARALIEAGGITCPTPCRCTKATGTPLSVPRVSGDDGVPKAVVHSTC